MYSRGRSFSLFFLEESLHSVMDGTGSPGATVKWHFLHFCKAGQTVLIDLLRAKWEKVPVLSSAPVFFLLSIILVIISSGIVDHLITDRACLFLSNSPDLKATISCRHLFCSLVILLWLVCLLKYGFCADGYQMEDLSLRSLVDRKMCASRMYIPSHFWSWSFSLFHVHNRLPIFQKHIPFLF